MLINQHFQTRRQFNISRLSKNFEGDISSINVTSSSKEENDDNNGNLFTVTRGKLLTL
jgi:hypothetical protein